MVEMGKTEIYGLQPPNLDLSPIRAVKGNNLAIYDKSSSRIYAECMTIVSFPVINVILWFCDGRPSVK